MHTSISKKEEKKKKKTLEKRIRRLKYYHLFFFSFYFLFQNPNIYSTCTKINTFHFFSFVPLLTLRVIFHKHPSASIRGSCSDFIYEASKHMKLMILLGEHKSESFVTQNPKHTRTHASVAAEQTKLQNSVQILFGNLYDLMQSWFVIFLEPTV
jgi:hypothetical protein